MVRTDVRYLRLIGRLYPDNRLVLRPAYLTDDPRFLPSGDRHALQAELLDDDGRVLARSPVPATPYCTMSRLSTTLAVRADLPFAEKTRRIRFLRDDVLVHEIDVPPHSPRVKLTWRSGAEVRGKSRITWRADHPDGNALHYIVRYSHDDGATWRRIGDRTSETSAAIDFAALPGGKRCRVAVLATDGVNTDIARSGAFAVPVKACVALVLAPEDGTRITPGEALTLRGQGFYLEEQAAELEDLIWSSDRDGELGRGPLITVGAPSAGRHRITLVAGRGRRAGKAVVAVEVGRATKR